MNGFEDTPEEPVIDEAMMTLSDMVQDLVEPFEPEQDKEQQISMSLVSIHLDMPVQLQVSVAADGKVTLGLTPPLYQIETSFAPVFHQVRFTCEKEE